HVNFDSRTLFQHVGPVRPRRQAALCGEHAQQVASRHPGLDSGNPSEHVAYPLGVPPINDRLSGERYRCADSICSRGFRACVSLTGESGVCGKQTGHSGRSAKRDSSSAKSSTSKKSIQRRVWVDEFVGGGETLHRSTKTLGACPMSQNQLPPPESEACLFRLRSSTQKGGTLIAEDVTEHAKHERRICDPDGYRPPFCPRCGKGPLHVHDYRER